MKTQGNQSMSILLTNLCLILLLGWSDSFYLQPQPHQFSRVTTIASKSSSSLTNLALFKFSGGGPGSSAKIPSSTNERDKQAINAVIAAIQKPRDASNPLIECEFPALAALNKLGDGSLRSTLEAEDANIAFASKLVNGIANSPAPFLGPKVTLVVSSSASNSFLSKTKQKVKGGGTTIYSLKEGLPNTLRSESDTNRNTNTVCVFLTPSSRTDYRTATSLSESGTVKAVVVVNGFAKDPRSIPGSATMAYFLKPLTYNSQVAGFLIRSYPSAWTVVDAVATDRSVVVLGTFSDDEILVPQTNTPDLRPSGKLVQRSVDERAIRARAGL